MSTIKGKLLLAFSAVILIPIAFSGYQIVTESSEALEEAALLKLVGLRESKAAQLEQLFKTMADQSKTLAKNPSVISAMKEFKQSSNDYSGLVEDPDRFYEMKASLKVYYEEQFGTTFKNKNSGINPEIEKVFDQIDPLAIAHQFQYIADNPFPLGEKHNLTQKEDQTSWSKAHGFYHPFFKNYLETFEYYDIFLIDDVSGKIVYSVFKELDFATSLKDGPYKDSNFADLYRKLAEAKQDASLMVDLAKYYPSYDFPAGFIGSPIFDGDQRIGMIILQIPVGKIDAITTNDQDWLNSGYGETGESYLVGENLRMRSNSRFLVENEKGYLSTMKTRMNSDELTYVTDKSTTSLIQKINTPGVKKAFEGQTGTMTFDDYRGVAVLSAYKPLSINGTTWALVVEMDDEEATRSAKNLSYKYLVEGFIILVIGLILAYSLASRISSPIRHSSEVIDRLAKGQFDYIRPKSLPKDESGRMLQSIEKTLESLRDIFASHEINWAEVKDQKRRELEALEEAKLQKAEAEKAQKEALLEQEKAKKSQEDAEEARHQAELQQQKADEAALEAKQARQDAIHNNDLALKAKNDAELAQNEAKEKAEQAAQAEEMARMSSLEAKKSAENALAEKKRAEDALANGEESRQEAERLARLQQQESNLLQKQADEILKVVDLAAQGDLRPRLELDSDNVMGRVSRGINDLLGRLSETIKEICHDSKGLQNSSDRVSTLGLNLKGDANLVTNKAQSAKTEVEKIKFNIKDSANSSKEMLSTISEINRSTQSASEICRNAVVVAADATKTIEKLGKHSSEIDDVIKVISTIAGQTNLLALNASIEAARAGDSGRGFSVVANEVKELANQTTTATEEIRKKIEDIQSSSHDSSKAIVDISTIINQVNDLTTTIATAVEEQRATTENISQMLVEIDHGSGVITNDIKEVAEIAQQTFKASEETSSAAKVLEELADHLRSVTQEFKTNTEQESSSVKLRQVS